MNKEYLIGTKGIDVCKLKGFQIDPQSLTELWNRANNGEAFGDVEVKPGKNSTLTLTGPGFRIQRGRSNRTGSYTTVEIHAADWDGCNLENLNMERLFAKLDEILAYVWSVCGLRVSYRIEQLRITQCEINNTFAVTHVFEKYRRILLLFAYIFMNDKGVLFLSCASELKGALQEKSLLCQKSRHSTFALRIYDKTYEMFQTLGGVRAQVSPLMRMEFIFRNGQAVRSALGTDQLVDVTDQMIENAYQSSLDKLMAKTEKYLGEKLIYRHGRTGHDDTAANMFYRYCIQNRDFAGFLAEVMAYEATYQVPCLLDLVDVQRILPAYVKNGTLDPAAASWIENELLRVSSLTSQVGILTGQRQLLDEIYAAASAGCPQKIIVYR